jgi:Ca-activated chloride channel family protein
MRALYPTARYSLIAAVVLSAAFICLKSSAQEIAPAAGPHGPRTAVATNIVIPQSGAFSVTTQTDRVNISEVSADVNIIQQVATTTLDVSLANPSSRQQEAEMLVPLPDGAVIRSFTIGGSSNETTAKLLPKAEAKSIYMSIVSKLRDPGLLEFAGYNLVRSSVFPIPACGTQRVRLIYEQILKADGERIDYFLPRSESFESTNTPWKINVRIQSKAPISTVYSPSHQIATERPTAGQARASVIGGPKIEPGPFRVSYLVERNGISASLMTYPDPQIGGGYFLLLAGVPAAVNPEQASSIKREVTLVIDRSGSMENEKIDQARKAAIMVLDGLSEGESFNIIDYSDSIERFSERPVVKTEETTRNARAYIRKLKADGGTNIKDALVEALQQPPTPDALPLVIFLTDGLPTVGETRESAIKSAIIAANKHKRRIFTFGVGYDVNAPLLTSIAGATRAASSFVLPKENVEAKVSQVFRRLSGPVLSDPRIVTLDGNGQVTTVAVREVLPRELSDVFEGDQIVLLGQYQDGNPLVFQLSGNYYGSQRAFDFRFDLNKATTRNSFVPRLWASRKIARLVEQIAEAGADGSAAAGTYARITNSSPVNPSDPNVLSTGDAAPAVLDPKLKELVDEIVRLSTEYGILTEYTSFLATDGTDFSQTEALNKQAQQSLVNNAQNTRTGVGGVRQAMNNSSQSVQMSLNRSNNFLVGNMNRVEFTNVQQVTDRTFFRRNNRWVDARVLGAQETAKPDKVLEFGSPEFLALLDRLVSEGRQGILALSGDLLLMVDGKTVLIKAPAK